MAETIRVAELDEYGKLHPDTIPEGVGGGIPAGLITTAGDLIVGGSDGAPRRLAAGVNGQVLTRDTASASGLKWVTPATSGSGSGSVGGAITGLRRFDITIPGKLAVGVSEAAICPGEAGWIRRIVGSLGTNAGDAGLLVNVLRSPGTSPYVQSYTTVFPTPAGRLTFNRDPAGAVGPAYPTDIRDYAREDVSPAAGYPAATTFKISVDAIASTLYTNQPGADLTVSILWEPVT